MSTQCSRSRAREGGSLTPLSRSLVAAVASPIDRGGFGGGGRHNSHRAAAAVQYCRDASRGVA